MAENKKTFTTVIAFCRFLSEYKENLNDSVQVFSRTLIALVMENGRVVQDFIRIPPVVFLAGANTGGLVYP